MRNALRLPAVALLALGVVACADDAPPPIVSAPAPQLVDRNFIVFFPTASHHLDASAHQTLDAAAAAARAGSMPRIVVRGHTDTAGPMAYNQGLSERRAAAVARALHDRGVPADRLTMVAEGETALLRPTRDGVHDPRNRRAELDFN